VTSAVISDLHLGARTKADLLRRPDVRRRLLAELEHVDQLVLLGDTIELRDGPIAGQLAAAAPFFEELGEALCGRRVILVAGNHDYQLASPWLERHRIGGSNRQLGLEQLSSPSRGDPLAHLAQRMPGTELVLAYPGVWLRPDVYATHGHYLDCHNHAATFECLAAAVSRRLIRKPTNGFRSPDDYEAVLAPLYRLIYRLVQSPQVSSIGKALVRQWEVLNGYRGEQGRLGLLLHRLVVPGALRGANRLGLGDFRDDRPDEGLRRPGLAAMAQVVDYLHIGAAYVLFGHLHRPGPLNGDGQRWRTKDGLQLVNTGSWLYEPAYLAPVPVESPYWPGTCVFVRDNGAPELQNPLRGLAPEDLGKAR
jgi:hypothetical protein